MDWPLAETKNKFSERFNWALAKSPQHVRRRDEAVVVIAASNDERLAGSRPKFKDLIMGAGPDLEGLDLHRDRDLMRDIYL